MGQGASYFTTEEQNKLLEETGFSPQEIQEIQKRYSKLDKATSADETYGIPVDDLMKIPELSGCKLARFVAEKYGGRSQILFPRETVLFFGELSSHRTPQEKVEGLFKLLDVKKMGYLSGIEMYRYYHTLFTPGLSDQRIKEITENLLQKVGGKIDLEKFKEIMPAWEVSEKLTVDLQLS
ncbi:uncharacterized protein LOC120337913 [Styela clava]